MPNILVFSFITKSIKPPVQGALKIRGGSERDWKDIFLDSEPLTHVSCGFSATSSAGCVKQQAGLCCSAVPL